MICNLSLVMFSGLLIGQFTEADLRDPTGSILKRLASENSQDRIEAARHLQFMYRGGVDDDAAPDQELMSALLKGLKDPDAKVRELVSYTLARFGKSGKPAIPLLADMMANEKAIAVRTAAAEAMLGLAPFAKEIVPIKVLTKSKSDDDKIIRILSGATLAVVQDNDDDPIRFLMNFSKDSDSDIRYESASVFVNIGSRSIPLLKPGLSDQEAGIRYWTVSAIRSVLKRPAEIEKIPADIIPLLIKLIEGSDDAIAINAMNCVSQLGQAGKDAIPAIIKHFKNPDWEMRWRAIRCITDFGPPAELAIPALKVALNDMDGRVRSAAKHSLKLIEEAKKMAPRKMD